jgi:hypothetical protein
MYLIRKIGFSRTMQFLQGIHSKNSIKCVQTYEIKHNPQSYYLIHWSHPGPCFIGIPLNAVELYFIASYYGTQVRMIADCVLLNFLHVSFIESHRGVMVSVLVLSAVDRGFKP